MKHDSRSSPEGFSKLRQWIRTSVPLVAARRDLLGTVTEVEEQGFECSFAMGAEVNRSGNPVLVELRHGEVFVFPSEDEASLWLDSPFGAWTRFSRTKAADPPEERVELVDFRIDEADRFDPDQAITGECQFRFLPGADPLESIVFEGRYGQGVAETFPGFGGAPNPSDPFPGDAGIGPPVGGEAFGSGLSAHGAPGESFGSGLDYCFALDFDVVHRRGGRIGTTRVTRYAYPPVHRGMTSVRFEFEAGSREADPEQELVPRAAPVYLRLCAAPPPARNLSPAPLSRANAKLVCFRRESP